MKAKSTVFPEKFKIEKKEDVCELVLCDTENVTEIEEIMDDKTVISYEYEMYRINVMYRENLSEDLSDAKIYGQYLEFAKSEEYNQLASEVRNKRTELLNGTDWTQVADVDLADKEKEEYKVYRQELRDITKQEGFPYDVVFPNEP